MAKKKTPKEKRKSSAEGVFSSAQRLLNSPLIGMWKDRTDIGDSVEFARMLRWKAEHRNERSTFPVDSSLSIDVDSIRCGGTEAVLPNLDKLADQIALLEPSDQRALLEKIAERNFRRGLEELSQEYRDRLAQEKKANQTAEEILVELEATRERVARDDSFA